jgi:hypothetical protein
MPDSLGVVVRSNRMNHVFCSEAGGTLSVPSLSQEAIPNLSKILFIFGLSKNA